MAESVGTRNATQAPPCTVVIFGATGDLTARLLMPAIYNLSRTGLLSQNFALVGLGRTQQSDDAFRQSQTDAMKRFVASGDHGGTPNPLDEKAWDFIASRTSYMSGDLADAATYQELSKKLDQISAKNGTKGNVLFYLAVAAQMFGPIIDQLGAAGLAEEKDGYWRRVIIEKPFGTDLDSAKALNTRVLKVLNENQVYRMDHFLGKETVQNIMALRFANGIFEPLWNRDHIDHVQITVAETVSVEHRAAFYEQTGAMRDMVPNHVFQLVSLTAMEPPNSFDPDAVRTEKSKALQAIEPFDDDALRRNVVRGQYAGGTVRGEAVPAYRNAEGVAPDSMTETFVAMRLNIDTWRWAGVPFYLRTGKSMGRRTTQIAIQFKGAPLALFRDTAVDNISPNVLVLQIQPDEGVSLQFSAKRPGPEIHLGGVKMDFRYKDYFNAAPATGYETLVYDCMVGDPTLFQRADSVEAGWSVVQPIFDMWKNDRSAPLEFYPAGSAGPEGSDQMLWRSGRAWRSLD
ncbi:MAG: glucose-6-phosphate dehydrogenase [Alphaproteobacteria bacterium]|nr:glucose-6-phosphate dehydrogenase [Alphaproteobacteria bacterium]